ncbi:hypothetical protein LCGC14_1697920 [marine sediment metagenome]|uniref:DUF3168 domain-containing protein n=1 Tax=marine sediment metagenome TaxID=412755 RepID=A0A0F9JZD3_9ZZZZ
MAADTNAIIREYLASHANAVALQALVGARIYSPRLPEGTTLPAVGFLTRGGDSTPYIPGMVTPSVQFDCWAENAIEARQVYGALYDALQGIQMVDVTVAGNTYVILSSQEEVQGQDIPDADIVGYFKVLTFFSIKIRAEV